MSTTKVTEIIGRVEDISQDTNVRWPRLELQNWLNEAYTSVVLARPDAGSKTGTFTCAAGTRQTLTSQFTDILRLLDVVRNVAAGSTKRAVRLIPRNVLDDQRPTWHAEAGTIDIQSWVFDPRQPKEFFVYPPALNTAELEVVYSAPVGVHALSEAALDPAGAEATTILVDDIYAGPLVDWILYRAYSKDATYAANADRAMKHLNAFTAVLGAKNTTDSAADPQNSSTVT